MRYHVIIILILLLPHTVTGTEGMESVRPHLFVDGTGTPHIFFDHEIRGTDWYSSEMYHTIKDGNIWQNPEIFNEFSFPNRFPKDVITKENGIGLHYSKETIYQDRGYYYVEFTEMNAAITQIMNLEEFHKFFDIPYVEKQYMSDSFNDYGNDDVNTYRIFPQVIDHLIYPNGSYGIIWYIRSDSLSEGNFIKYDNMKDEILYSTLSEDFKIEHTTVVPVASPVGYNFEYYDLVYKDVITLYIDAYRYKLSYIDGSWSDPIEYNDVSCKINSEYIFHHNLENNSIRITNLETDFNRTLDISSIEAFRNYDFHVKLVNDVPYFTYIELSKLYFWKFDKTITQVTEIDLNETSKIDLGSDIDYYLDGDTIHLFYSIKVDETYEIHTRYFENGDWSEPVRITFADYFSDDIKETGSQLPFPIAYMLLSTIILIYFNKVLLKDRNRIY